MLKRMFSIVPFNKMNFSVNPKYSLVYIVKGKRVIGLIMQKVRETTDIIGIVKTHINLRI